MPNVVSIFKGSKEQTELLIYACDI